MRRLLPLLLAAALTLAGCSLARSDTPEPPGPSASAPEAAFPRTIDVPAGADLPATSLTLESEPHRVVALTYETGELVAALGAMDRLVLVQEALGNPVLSEHAEAMSAVEHHAATEGSVDVEAVIAAQPDLVLLSARRGLEDGVTQALEGAGVPVLVLPNHWADLDDMATNIELVGQALGTEEAAENLTSDLTTGLADESDPNGPRVLVLSNQAGRPFVTAGEAFPLELLRRAGARNAGDSLGLARSGPISAEQVIAADPDAVLLVDMNGSGEQAFTPLLSNPAVANLPAVAEDRVLLLEGRQVQALGFRATIEGRRSIAHWLDGVGKSATD